VKFFSQLGKYLTKKATMEKIMKTRIKAVDRAILPCCFAMYCELKIEHIVKTEKCQNKQAIFFEQVHLLIFKK
jgi:hypothetical protein